MNRHFTGWRERTIIFMLLAHCGFCGAQRVPAADAGQRSVWDGAFTAAQDQRGGAVYARACALCHGPTLNGGEAPPLAGADFLAQWNGYNAGDLFERIRSTMPVAGPGSLSAQQYADVLAHILSVNKFPAGATELETSRERLSPIRIEAKLPR